jgi:hypothetical protein
LGPWALTFSFSRAMQSSCLQKWGGRDDNVKAAQDQLLARAVYSGTVPVGTKLDRNPTAVTRGETIVGVFHFLSRGRNERVQRSPPNTSSTVLSNDLAEFTLPCCHRDS